MKQLRHTNHHDKDYLETAMLCTCKFVTSPQFHFRRYSPHDYCYLLHHLHSQYKRAVYKYMYIYFISYHYFKHIIAWKFYLLWSLCREATCFDGPSSSSSLCVVVRSTSRRNYCGQLYLLLLLLLHSIICKMVYDISITYCRSCDYTEYASHGVI